MNIHVVLQRGIAHLDGMVKKADASVSVDRSLLQNSLAGRPHTPGGRKRHWKKPAENLKKQ